MDRLITKIVLINTSIFKQKRNGKACPAVGKVRQYMIMMKKR